MESFATHLLESVSSPQEFTITDDTVMPREVYANFQVDSVDYGVSLKETNFDKIYVLDIYKINNKKPRFWKFTKPAHVRVCFSTAIKFVESVTPWVKNKMDAVVIRIPTVQSPQKYDRLAKQLLAKTYIKSFRYVPVSFDRENPQEKKRGHHFIFFARKQVNPKMLFNNVRFKNYTFLEDGEVPSDFAEDIKDKKAKKMSVSMTQSPKYKIKGFEVAMTDFENENFFSEIDKKTAKFKTVDTGNKQEVIKAAKAKEKAEKNFNKEISNMSNAQLLYSIVDDVLDYQFGHIFAQKKEYSKDQFDWNEISHAVYMNDYRNMHAYEELRKRYKWNGMGNFPKEMIDAIDKDFKKIKKVSHVYDLGDSLQTMKSLKLKKMKAITDFNNVKSDDYLIDKSEIDLETLDSNIPGFGKLKYENGTYVEGEEEDISAKKQHMMFALGYDDFIQELPEVERKLIKKYTGSGYSSFNTPLRAIGSALLDKNTEVGAKSWGINYQLESYDSYIQNSKDLYNTMMSAKPLPEPIWVYRGGHAPDYVDAEVGKDYFDPAFMSTSILSTISYSGLRFYIYLPAGSKVLPILDFSQHKSEYEVLLPPMSALRVVQVIKENGGNLPVGLVCIYLGSAFSDFRENVLDKKSFDEIPEKYYMTEAKKDKDKKYDPYGKFAPKIDPKFSNHMEKLFKSGKIKLDKKTKK